MRHLLLAAASVLCLVGFDAGARSFDIEAHRGGRALWPENTLQSFAHALSLGVDTLELDLGVTKDDVIVVSHDRHLNPDLARDASGTYVAAPGPTIRSLTLAEIKQYDFGQIRPDSAYAKNFAEQQAIPGTRMPTLAEVFDLVRRSGNKKVRLNIETKIDPDHPDETVSPERFVELLLALLRKEGFTDRVLIQSFDWRTLQLVQKQTREIPTVYLTMQKGPAPTVSLDKPSAWTAGFDPVKYDHSLLKAIKAAGGNVWSPLYYDVEPALVQEAHQLGLQVIPWTVNSRADMERLIDMGVDGLISDRPDLLRTVSAEKGIALPAATPVTP